MAQFAVRLQSKRGAAMFILSKNRTSIHRVDESNSRQGVAVVEVALCLPVLLLVTLLFIEFTNLLFLRQSLKVASYEGIRVAVKQSADLSDVIDVCAAILDSRQVNDYEISVEPEDFTTLPRGELTTVTIEVDKSENQLFGLLLGTSESIVVQSFGLKE
jgi:hypothetical protein